MKRSSIIILAVIVFTPFLSAQWTKQSFPTSEYLWKVRFANEQTGWITGATYIYKTTNGGGSWTKQDTSIGYCDAMFALSDKIVMFSNWPGAGTFVGGIRRTTDGGSSWTTVSAENNYYSDIDFGSTTVGYASSGGITGTVPMMRKTTDAGATWFTVSQNFPKAKHELTGVAFVNENLGWTVTYDGFVYKTTNGGVDWSAPDSLGFESFRDIEFFNKDTGWVFGGIGGEMVVVRTTNGGTSWTKTKKGGGSLREGVAVSSKMIFVAGMNDSIIGSANAGEIWTNQPSERNGYESLDMVNQKIGYAVGPSGTVYKTTNGGVSSVIIEEFNSIPTKYSLEQNFPNPFNPSTTIRFSIPAKEIVSLKIFSITGELIDELISKPMDAGNYSITWNAQGRPSGVYFYTLTSGNFSETKKLAFLK